MDKSCIDDPTHRLVSWFENEKKEGLVDMKFNMSRNSESLTRDYASDVLNMLEEWKHGYSKDITNKRL